LVLEVHEFASHCLRGQSALVISFGVFNVFRVALDLPELFGALFVHFATDSDLVRNFLVRILRAFEIGGEETFGVGAKDPVIFRVDVVFAHVFALFEEPFFDVAHFAILWRLGALGRCCCGRCRCCSCSCYIASPVRIFGLGFPVVGCFWFLSLVASDFAIDLFSVRATD